MPCKPADILVFKYHTYAVNKIIEQVNLFNYLGNMIPYEGELGIDKKLNNFFENYSYFK